MEPRLQDCTIYHLGEVRAFVEGEPYWLGFILEKKCIRHYEVDKEISIQALETAFVKANNHRDMESLEILENVPLVWYSLSWETHEKGISYN